MKEPDPQDWTPYWQRPTVTSFGDIFPDSYDGEILDFWKKQLRGKLDHVVDVACGNGALTWIGNDILNQGARKTRITGVDFADISPFRVLSKKKKLYPEVRFIGKTPAENMPFKDGSIDLVMSQYGIEYTNLEKTIPEIARVLVSSGRMSFVLHDKESVIIKRSTVNLDDYRTVLNDIAIHDFALEVDDLYRRVKNPATRQGSSEYQKLVSSINSSGEKVRALVRDYQGRSPIHLYMERLNQALAQTHDHQKTSRTALIHLAHDGLRAHIERIEDLEVAALSAEGRQHLVCLIENAGFAIIEKQMLPYKRDDNVGTTFVAQRL